MGDPQALGINIANIVLAALVALCLLVVVYAALRELAVRRKRRLYVSTGVDRGAGLTRPHLRF